jgi:hypothetical protein
MIAEAEFGGVNSICRSDENVFGLVKVLEYLQEEEALYVRTAHDGMVCVRPRPGTAHARRSPWKKSGWWRSTASSPSRGTN